MGLAAVGAVGLGERKRPATVSSRGSLSKVFLASTRSGGTGKYYGYYRYAMGLYGQIQHVRRSF